MLKKSFIIALNIKKVAKKGEPVKEMQGICG
jgi:hypothetical protein